jgi:hypothetical protein
MIPFISTKSNSILNLSWCILHVMWTLDRKLNQGDVARDMKSRHHNGRSEAKHTDA